MRVILRQVIGWLFLGGFVFLLGVAMWAVVTINRMRHQQLAALSMLTVLSAKAGLEAALDKARSNVETARAEGKAEGAEGKETP